VKIEMTLEGAGSTFRLRDMDEATYISLTREIEERRFVNVAVGDGIATIPTYKIAMLTASSGDA
jgi:hypothetical protein